MKGPKALGLGLLAPAAIALALIAGLVAYSQVSATAHAVSIGSTTADVGAQGTVDLDGLNMTAPGLGAWTIDIVYDPATVSVVSCTSAVGLCNPNFAANTIRANGTSLGGLVGDTTLASITFECDVAGSSALTLTVQNLADANPPPQPITATLTNGSVTCATVAEIVQEPTPTPAPTPTPTAVAELVQLPTTGGTPSDAGSSALPWLAAIAGAVALIGSGSAWFAYQRRRVR